MESLSRGVNVIQALFTGPALTFSLAALCLVYLIFQLDNIFGYLADLRKLVACCLWNIMCTKEVLHPCFPKC